MPVDVDGVVSGSDRARIDDEQEGPRVAASDARVRQRCGRARGIGKPALTRTYLCECLLDCASHAISKHLCDSRFSGKTAVSRAARSTTGFAQREASSSSPQGPPQPACLQECCKHEMAVPANLRFGADSGRAPLLAGSRARLTACGIPLQRPACPPPIPQELCRPCNSAVRTGRQAKRSSTRPAARDRVCRKALAPQLGRSIVSHDCGPTSMTLVRCGVASGSVLS